MPDGDIRLCGCRALYTFKDELVIGNIKKDSIKSCINSEKYHKLICNFKNNKVPKVCKKCTFYKPKN
jgi:radical SAM protein with 4Fe4S-binding SPASM domain